MNEEDASKIVENALQKQKEEAEVKTEGKEVSKISDKAAVLISDSLNSKINELKEMEKKLDEKVETLKKLTADTEMSGKSIMQNSREITEEDKVKAEANKVLEAVGFKLL